MAIFGGWGGEMPCYIVKRTEKQKQIVEMVESVDGKVKREDVSMILEVFKENGMGCAIYIEDGKNIGVIYIHSFSVDSIGRATILPDRKIKEGTMWSVGIYED